MADRNVRPTNAGNLGPPALVPAEKSLERVWENLLSRRFSQRKPLIFKEVFPRMVSDFMRSGGVGWSIVGRAGLPNTNPGKSG
jgi:hypothetical protein